MRTVHDFVFKIFAKACFVGAPFKLSNAGSAILSPGITVSDSACRTVQGRSGAGQRPLRSSHCWAFAGIAPIWMIFGPNGLRHLNLSFPKFARALGEKTPQTSAQTMLRGGSIDSMTQTALSCGACPKTLQVPGSSAQMANLMLFEVSMVLATGILDGVFVLIPNTLTH